MNTKEYLKKAIESDDMMMVMKALRNAPDGTTIKVTDNKVQTYTKENGMWLTTKAPDCDGRDYTTSSDLTNEWVYGTEITIL